VVADFESIFFERSLTETNDFTDKFVPGSDRRLAPPGAAFVTPEPGSALEAFDVTAADTGRQDANQNFLRPRLWHRQLFKPEIAASMVHHGVHPLWEMVGFYSHGRCEGTDFQAESATGGRIRQETEIFVDYVVFRTVERSLSAIRELSPCTPSGRGALEDFYQR
jgi:hypothetical protein